jgi:hypothetical protein
MGWREDVKFGIARVSRLFLGTDNGELGVEVTASAEEINQLAGGWDSITLTSETGASGSCAVQIVFNDADGDPLAVPVTGDFYLSEVATGLTMDPADTGIAVLTNGGLFELDAAHKGWKFVSSAAGLLGFTITAAADSYWAIFAGPNGKLVSVGPLIVDA